MNKGSTKEIVNLALVESTAVDQISHMLTESIRRRKKFGPRALFSDITPSNKLYWKRLFGPQLSVRLGLFHLNHHDHAALLRCLKEGNMNTSGEKMTDQGIRMVRHSKRWKQRYERYLRKKMKPEELIKSSLGNWKDRYVNITDTAGQSLFSKDTEKVVSDQIKKVEHATEPDDMMTYIAVPPPKNSPNHLTRWQSTRPESQLEKAHEAMAHFANTCMNPSLANTLTLAGVTKRNVACRWKMHMNEKRRQGIDIGAPLHFADVPEHMDHSLLHKLNQDAQLLGLSIPFKFVTPIQENNGEEFLLGTAISLQSTKCEQVGKGDHAIMRPAQFE